MRLSEFFTNTLINDVIKTTQKNIEKFNIRNTEDIRNAPQNIAQLSPDMYKIKNQIKTFLFKNVYSHYTLMRQHHKSCTVIKSLFNVFMDSPKCLPTVYYKMVEWKNDYERANIIKYYIAGMTDSYAIDEYRALKVDY